MMTILAFSGRINPRDLLKGRRTKSSGSPVGGTSSSAAEGRPRQRGVVSVAEDSFVNNPTPERLDQLVDEDQRKKKPPSTT